MSRDMILLVKLECPYGSIERSEKALRDDGGSGSGCRVSSQSIFLSFCLLLAEADAKCEREEGKKQRCAREGKNH
jgi:hypothetical protein